MQPRKIKDEADARACLAAVKAAGCDAVTWSRANGVDARSLHAWRMNLGPKSKRVTAHALVELVPTTRPSGARYVLDLGGARLEFDDLCSTETLQRVVRALRAC
jgi:hypothetical protein